VPVPEREERFTRALDRLLAGKEPEALPYPGDGETLAFARKMAALRPMPDEHFKSLLKARLLQELAGRENERASKRGWLLSLLRRPAYAAVLAALFLALIFGGLWAAGVFNPSQAPFTPSVVKVEAETAKNTYSRGEQVVVSVSLENITGDTLSFTEFPPILSLMKASDHMAAYTFPAGSGTKSLAPGEAASFTLTWDQRDAAGNQVPAGRYYVELEDLYYKGAVVKLTPVTPVEFRIA
jgi:hypothetical protein